MEFLPSPRNSFVEKRPFKNSCFLSVKSHNSVFTQSLFISFVPVFSLLNYKKYLHLENYQEFFKNNLNLLYLDIFIGSILFEVSLKI